MTLFTPMRLIPCLLTLTCPVLAQVPANVATSVPPSVRKGMFSATPMGFLTDASNGLPDVRIIDSGNSGGQPQPWSATRFGPAGDGYPDYSLQALFGAQALDIELTAVSTGNDLMPATTSAGQLIMQQVWFSLTVSVTNESEAMSGHVARLIANQTAPGAELFTYYASDSVGIDASLPNTVVAERSRTSLGLSGEDDLRGLDFGLGIIPFDPRNRAGRMWGARNTFYFAVSDDCIDALGQTFAAASPGALPSLPADSATIYACSWSDAATAGIWAWSPPYVYRSYIALDLDPEVDQIDAIAIDSLVDRVIFSTQVSSLRNQLMVLQNSQTEPRPLRASNGILVTEHFGFTEDTDVDGTCGADPEAQWNRSGSIGIPQFSFPTTQKLLGISVARTQPGPALPEKITVEVSGTEGGTVLLFATSQQLAPFGSPRTHPGNWVYLGSANSPTGQNEVEWVFHGTNSVVQLAVLGYYRSYEDAGLERASWVSLLD